MINADKNNTNQKPLGRIAFVVGHENWGKSRTLQALTSGQHRSMSVVGVDFFIRRMSNDDHPEGYREFMEGLNVNVTPNLIAAFCPNFVRPNANAEYILRMLHEHNYTLFFWVILHKFGTDETVAPLEIAELQRHGVVSVFDDVAEADERASEFLTFVTDVVLA